MDDNTYDIIIVGGGIIGMSLGYFLSRQNLHILIIEKDEVANGASGKAGGFLAKSWNDGTDVGPLSHLSFDLLKEYCQDKAEEVQYRETSTKIVYTQEEEEDKNDGELEEVDDNPLPSLISPSRISHQEVMESDGKNQQFAQVHPYLLTQSLMRDLLSPNQDQESDDDHSDERRRNDVKEFTAMTRLIISNSTLEDEESKEGKIMEEKGEKGESYHHQSSTTKSRYEKRRRRDEMRVIGVETKSSNFDRRGSKDQTEDDGEEIVRYFCRMGVVLALGPWTNDLHLSLQSYFITSSSESISIPHHLHQIFRVPPQKAFSVVLSPNHQENDKKKKEKEENVTISPTFDQSCVFLYQSLSKSKVLNYPHLHYSTDQKDPSKIIVDPEIYPRPDGSIYICNHTSDSPHIYHHYSKMKEEESLFEYSPTPLPSLSSSITPQEADVTFLMDHIIHPLLSISILEDSIQSSNNEEGDSNIGYHLSQTQSCYLPLSNDNLPIIGDIPFFQNLYISTGHSCWGILNSMGSASLLSNYILHKLDLSPSNEGQILTSTNDDDLKLIEPFLPARMIIR